MNNELPSFGNVEKNKKTIKKKTKNAKTKYQSIFLKSYALVTTAFIIYLFLQVIILEKHNDNISKSKQDVEENLKSLQEKNSELENKMEEITKINQDSKNQSSDKVFYETKIKRLERELRIATFTIDNISKTKNSPTKVLEKSEVPRKTKRNLWIDAQPE